MQYMPKKQQQPAKQIQQLTTTQGRKPSTTLAAADNVTVRVALRRQNLMSRVMALDGLLRGQSTMHVQSLQCQVTVAYK